jgi:hypothetical protein
VDAIRKRPFDFIKANQEEGLLLGSYDLEDKELGNSPATRLTEWKRQLFEGVEPSERDILLSLIVFLFPDFANWHSAEKPQNPEAGLRICAAGPLMKLLSSGQAEGIPSVVEVLSFLGSIEGRKEIIDGIVEDDMVAAWFDSLFCHVEKDYPEAPLELCDLTFYTVVKEFNLRNNDVIRDAAKFLQKLIRLIPDADEKHALFSEVVSNSKCLALAHNVIFGAINDHGKWIRKPGQGVSSEKRLIKSWDVVEQGKQRWLAAVKEKSKNQEEFLKEPQPLSILHGWGQFNGNDFTEVQGFIDTLTSTHKGMTTFFKLWHGQGFEGAELLIGDKKRFLERFDSHPDRKMFTDELVQYMTSIGDS